MPPGMLSRVPSGAKKGRRWEIPIKNITKTSQSPKCFLSFDLLLSQIVNPDTGENLGPNKDGEMCIRGPVVMKGKTALGAQQNGPSAHALVQQCCVNVAKRLQHHATSKMLRKKFDRFQI